MNKLRKEVKQQEELNVALNGKLDAMEQAAKQEKANLNTKYVGLIEEEKKESTELVTKLSAQKEENAKSEAIIKAEKEENIKLVAEIKEAKEEIASLKAKLAAETQAQEKVNAEQKV